MYGSDYPFNREHDGSVPAFLAAAGMTAAEQNSIASSNWETLVAGIRR